MVLALIRPDSWNLPLFLHVLGATLTFGATATVALLGFAGQRGDPDRSVWLRMSRLDHVYAFHASTDARAWSLIRVFTLGAATDDHRIGFEAQSPTGDGCVVTIDRISFTSTRLADLRDGS